MAFKFTAVNATAARSCMAGLPPYHASSPQDTNLAVAAASVMVLEVLLVVNKGLVDCAAAKRSIAATVIVEAPPNAARASTIWPQPRAVGFLHTELNLLVMVPMGSCAINSRLLSAPLLKYTFKAVASIWARKLLLEREGSPRLVAMYTRLTYSATALHEGPPGMVKKME